MAEASLYQSLSQSQTLAPQMRKSLEILQANTLELSQLLRQALEINPTLEDQTEMESLDEDTIDPEKADSMEYLNETDDDWRDQLIMESQNNNHSKDDEARRQRLYNSIVAPETLQQHLRNQLNFSLVEPEIKQAADVILGYLDDRGFLEMSVEEISQYTNCKLEDLQAALLLIKRFEPAGVGAKNIQETLKLQLERHSGIGTIEHQIVCNHLTDLARKRYPQIAKALSITVDRITEAGDVIARLSPNPGGEFDPTKNPYLLPDVIITKNDEGNWDASLTSEYLPSLRINDFYKDMMGKGGIDAKARAFLREQIRDGRSLIRSISLRQETILAIAHKIIEQQQEFLEKGPRHLRPLTMNHIADDLQLHATTISRAVAGKYMLTPHGFMEMRAFFATGYQTEGGTEVSNAGVREAIQQLIAQENPAKPFSDDTMVKKLKCQGIKVARRTIAKYRDQLGILPSHLRKTF